MELLRAAVPVLLGCVAGGGIMLSLTLFHYHEDRAGAVVFFGSLALVLSSVALARALAQD